MAEGAHEGNGGLGHCDSTRQGTSRLEEGARQKPRLQMRISRTPSCSWSCDSPKAREQVPTNHPLNDIYLTEYILCCWWSSFSFSSFVALINFSS